MNRFIQMALGFVLVATCFSVSYQNYYFLANEALASSKDQANKSLISDFFRNLFTRTGDAQGSRSSPFCSIWPNSENKKLLYIWSVRPLFIWKVPKDSVVKQIEVIDFITKQTILQHTLTKNEQKAEISRYMGTDLKSSGIYTYRISYEMSVNGTQATFTETIYFKIFKDEERRSIQADLNTLMNTNQDKEPEKIAQKRASYFAEHGLGADAIQEIFSVSKPSPEWQQELENLRNFFCPSPKSS